MVKTGLQSGSGNQKLLSPSTIIVSMVSCLPMWDILDLPLIVLDEGSFWFRFRFIIHRPQKLDNRAEAEPSTALAKYCNMWDNGSHSLMITRQMTTEAWWRRGNTLTSHCYGPCLSPGCCLGSTLTPDRMWDVFRSSQPMPGGFPLGVFFHPEKGSKLFQLEPFHKANWPGQNLFLVTWKQWLYLLPQKLVMHHCTGNKNHNGVFPKL